MTEPPADGYERTVAHERSVETYRHEYPAFDYEARVAELARRLESSAADAAVFPNPVELAYYAGTAQPANLLIPAGEPAEAQLFVRRAMGFAEQEVGLPDDRVEGGGLSELASHADGVDTLGLPLDVIPASLASKLADTFDAETVGVSELALRQRARKDDKEIELLRAAAGLYEHAHGAIKRAAEPGATEKEVAGAVVGDLVGAGMDDWVVFRRWDARLPASGLIASGETLPLISGHAMTITGTGLSRTLPWGPSNRRLEAGDFLVADIALNRAGYHGDVARTYVIGEASAAQQEWFDAVREIHEAAREAIEPGVAAEEPYLAGRQRAEELGVEAFLCGYAEMQAPYIGHSIGLEADEEPTLVRGNDAELREGMVLTIEPKLIHPDRGTVVVEDDYRVTAEGVERLSTVDQRLFEI
jgi:Xaa-Pro aminopeptidase